MINEKHLESMVLEYSEYFMENISSLTRPTLISGEFWQCFNSHGCFCRLSFVLENALINFTKCSLAQSSKIMKYLFLRISLSGATHLTRTRFSRSTSLRSCIEQVPPANSQLGLYSVIMIPLLFLNIKLNTSSLHTSHPLTDCDLHYSALQFSPQNTHSLPLVLSVCTRERVR